MRKWTRRLALVVVASAAAALAASTHAAVRGDGDGHRSDTRTPIRHLVVIFQENVSFDHYFGTYPNAANTGGQPFAAAPHTPTVDGLTPALLTSNPNSSQPARLDSSPTGLAGSAGGQLTCDQGHNYSDEQQAFDGGKMDQFVQSVGTGSGNSPFGQPCNASMVMNYYDGNTVTAFWNYAQRYAMSDNSFSPTFGPSSPGAINLVSGNTGNVDMTHTANNPSIATSAKPNADLTADGTGGYSLTSDAQPYWDDCSTRDAVALNGKNIGDELNAAGLSWGWFQGGQAPTTTFAAAAAAPPATPASRPRRSSPTSSPAASPARSCRRTRRTRRSATPSIRSASPSAARASGASRTTTSRITSRSTTTRRRRTRTTWPFRPTRPATTRSPGSRRSERTRSRTSAACRSSTRRTISTT